MKINKGKKGREEHLLKKKDKNERKVKRFLVGRKKNKKTGWIREEGKEKKKEQVAFAAEKQMNSRELVWGR